MLGFRSQRLTFIVATALLAAVVSIAVVGGFFEPFNVTYDHRALIIGGKRRMLISAGVHYPRATPEMWPGIILKCKEGGADVIQTYVFWNGHEPVRGQYYFEGRYDLVKFVKLVGSSGLYFHLRIGPYACAEWNFGGFPVWLRDIHGIEFRTNNGPFKVEIQRFVSKIVEMMKEEMLFSWQGGPIILLQIENEYGNVEGSYGEGGKEYAKWAVEMALSLGAGVPWVMCKQTDAPETVIDTCNGFYCDAFKPNTYKKPKIWTEDWNGWYASWGGRLPHRPVEDNAFAVARFFQRGGSYNNYYMFFGGTNFDRTAGGPFQITSYDYDAPIDEYGLLSEPKWGHLKDLHAAIKLCEPALVTVDHEPQYFKLGPRQEAHVYSNVPVKMNERLPKNMSVCSAFLANIDEHKSVAVKFFGNDYTLPPWSVIVLPDCKNLAFNTAQVGSQISIKTSSPLLSSYSNTTALGNLLLAAKDLSVSSTWMAFSEPIGIWNSNSFTTQQILEHLNVTKDASDYLWYITRINVSGEDITYWKKKGSHPALTIHSIRDVARIFLNGQLIGGTYGNWVKLEQTLQLVQGCNELALLSEAIGLKNYGAFIEKDGAGFRGPIKLTGFKDGEIDLSSFPWTYQVGLKGEFVKIFAPEEAEKVDWTILQPDKVKTPFTWYKTYFDIPEGKVTIALDLGSMGKGQAWVNGHGIGRYWSLVAPKYGCPGTCNYRGAYNENKCLTNCGKPTQTLYHIPREWLQASSNLLVIFEETGGDPLEIKLKKHATVTICSQVSETHYPPLSSWHHPERYTGNISFDKSQPEMHLHCDDGYAISSITFASFGTPHGSCQYFSKGKCHAQNSSFVISEACLGRNSCYVTVSIKTFSPDPCRGTVKTLAVQAECSPPSDYSLRSSF
ncbi:beta-galactosidase 9 isoform X1 [Dendrobium catenatum]|uniref:beta-galactosidase 9 isoform X1 n=2 Tax=Dendrobium catenatum TaxID=906689 RepID=UPI00109FA23F|nr:beta-galactosidase 9 isoform X1 [Dendrobium catenatum]